MKKLSCGDRWNWEKMGFALFLDDKFGVRFVSGVDKSGCLSMKQSELID